MSIKNVFDNVTNYENDTRLIIDRFKQFESEIVKLLVFKMKDLDISELEGISLDDELQIINMITHIIFKLKKVVDYSLLDGDFKRFIKYIDQNSIRMLDGSLFIETIFGDSREREYNKFIVISSIKNCFLSPLIRQLIIAKSTKK